MKRFVLVVSVMLVFPCLASAEINTDLRVKFGSAAGAEKVEIGNNITGEGQGKTSTNVQLEIAMSPRWESSFGFVMGIGVFHRKHSGEIKDPVLPTTMDYEVTGIDFAPGFRIKGGDNFHFEGRFELGYGSSGKATLKSPTMTWNRTQTGPYASAAFIAGWYYAFSRPGFLLGFELGLQSFAGTFKILNNNGYWDEGKMSGVNGTGNLLLGARF